MYSAAGGLMQIVINGEAQQVQNASTVAELLQQLGYRGNQFAVALNGEFVQRASYGQNTLSEGDMLDIVAPVVGG